MRQKGSDKSKIIAEFAASEEYTEKQLSKTDYRRSFMELTMDIVTFYEKEGIINLDEWKDNVSPSRIYMSSDAVGTLILSGDGFNFSLDKNTISILPNELGTVKQVFLKSYDKKDNFDPMSEKNLNGILSLIFANYPNKSSITADYILNKCKGGTAEWSEFGCMFHFDDKSDIGEEYSKFFISFLI